VTPRGHLRSIDGGLAPLPRVDGRAPPHDLDAEAAVLSVVLVDPAAMPRVAFLEPEHFYADAHGRIFEAARALETAKQPIDVVQVGTWLKNRERLVQVGGMAYLTEILNAAPAVANVDAYARVVVEKWRVRKAIAICQRAAALGYIDYGDAQSYLLEIEQSVAEVVRSGSGEAAETNLDALKRIVRGWSDNVSRVERGERPHGIPTGIGELDRLLNGLHARRSYLIAARPGGGKSALGMQVANHVAALGIGVGVFSMEMPRDEQLERLVSMRARVDNARIAAGRLDYAEWQRVAEASKEIAKLPITIDDGTYNIRELRARAMKMIADAAKTKHPLGLLVVDYVQWMPGTPERQREPRREQIAEASRGLKQLAKDTGIPVVALAQLNRAIDQRSGDVRWPRFSDIADCGDIERTFDVIVFIHQNAKVAENGEEIFEDEADARLIVAKARGGGKRGVVKVTFEKPYTRFVEPEAERRQGAFDGI
jgi:replicative DNA helicase